MNQNINPTFYVISYPESYWILPLYIKQFNKYVKNTTCVIMCYEYPTIKLDLPNNIKVVSITDGKPQGGSKKWASTIRKYLETVDDEYIIFSLDDYIITDQLDIDTFNSDMEKVKSNNIKRYVLGATCSLYDLSEWDGFLRFNQNSEYRISCQVSVWDRKYLIKHLNDGYDPWDFEIKSTNNSRIDDVNLVYKHKPVLRCIYNGAVSRRYNGRVNVLGMKIEDIKDNINADMFNGYKLQYGTLTEPALWYENIYDTFNIDMLKRYMDTKRYNDYINYYGDIYT